MNEGKLGKQIKFNDGQDFESYLKSFYDQFRTLEQQEEELAKKIPKVRLAEKERIEREVKAEVREKLGTEITDEEIYATVSERLVACEIDTETYLGKFLALQRQVTRAIKSEERAKVNFEKDESRAIEIEETLLGERLEGAEILNLKRELIDIIENILLPAADAELKKVLKEEDPGGFRQADTKVKRLENKLNNLRGSK